MRSETENIFYMLLGLLLIALLLMWIEDSQAASAARARYTFTSAHSSLLFYNHETLPFQVIRQMCWNSSEGWCDPAMQVRAREVWIVTDWHEQRQGAIYSVSGECFWWMYQPSYGADNHPHIIEHYWIECPVFPVSQGT